MRSALVAGGRRSLKGESWKDPRCVFLNILVGIDGSPSSQRALDHAVELTRAANAKLTLMTVAPPTSSYVTLAGMSAQTMTDELDKWAAGVLDEATRAVPDDVIARRVQSRGHAGPEILKELGRGGYDLIVLGTRGRGRTQEGLLGSVNGYIHFHAKVPLLSVPDESGD
jgi:nucleotide-binding universal stress UspA family protein